MGEGCPSFGWLQLLALIVQQVHERRETLAQATGLRVTRP